MQMCGCFLSCCGIAYPSLGPWKYLLMALFQAELASPDSHVQVIIIAGKTMVKYLLLNQTRVCPPDVQQSQTLDIEVCNGEIKAVLFKCAKQGEWEAVT